MTAAVTRPDRRGGHHRRRPPGVDPALAYAARGVFAPGVEAGRRAIGSPDRVALGVLDNLPRQVPVVIQGARYAPDAVLGAMVHNVVAAVAAGKGEPPGRLTVAHPTHWSRGQIDALIDAVRSAARGSGLQLIPNAVAVAVDHAIGHPLADGAAVAVLDIGAAGYEAAVVGRRATRVDLLAPQIERGVIGGNQFR